MKKELILHGDMGAAVLRHLSQFGNIPKKGILAGQSVDSAIRDLYLGGGGVYNDVDIFRQSPGDSRLRDTANHTAFRCEVDWRRIEYREPIEGALDNSSYGFDAAVLLQDSYGIASVSRDDMLNFVNCYQAPGKYGHKLTAPQVIRGFDINATRVAVDLSTQKLYWDAYYEEFLRSRQLRIVMMHTPWHTLVRILRKAEQLPGVFLDKEEAITSCVAFSQSRSYLALAGKKNTVTQFGQVMKAKALETEPAWREYLDLHKVTYRRLPHAYPHAKPAWAETEQGAPEAADSSTVALWRMAPRGQVEADLQKKINRLGLGSVIYTSQLVREHRRRKKGQVHVKLDSIIANRAAVSRENRSLDFVHWCAEVFGTAYVEGQALPTVAEKISGFLKKHGLLKAGLIGLTLAEQNATIERVKKLVKSFAASKGVEDFEQFIGVLELEATASDLQSEEAMTRVLNEAWQRDQAPFNITPLPLQELSAYYKSFLVEELLSPQALKDEGTAMQHCVGGYSNAVTSGNSRIVRIRGPLGKSQWSTVELGRRRSSNKYVVNQHRTRLNKEPHAANKALLGCIVDYLNMPAHLKKVLHEDNAWRSAQRKAKGLQIAVHFLTRIVRTTPEEHTKGMRQKLGLLQTTLDELEACLDLKSRLDHAQLAPPSSEVLCGYDIENDEEEEDAMNIAF